MRLYFLETHIFYFGLSALLSLYCEFVKTLDKFKLQV